uniref:Transmembrane protein 238 n=1 Tax=Eptatretus burgeri TaxID=7764 RepID=A0A8C4QYS9_EPTBU
MAKVTCGCIDRCPAAFWLAVLFDLVGLTLLIVGIFIQVDYFDLLIYCGAILIFLSLAWWVFWYAGNIEFEVDDFGWEGALKMGCGGF